MTRKTARRNIDVVSKEEWKALVKAQEQDRTHLLSSGMGTGTGTGTGTEERVIHQIGSYDIRTSFEANNLTWNVTGIVNWSIDTIYNRETGEYEILLATASFSAGATAESMTDVNGVTTTGNNMNFVGSGNYVDGYVSRSQNQNFIFTRTAQDNNGNEYDAGSSLCSGSLSATCSYKINPDGNGTIDHVDFSAQIPE